MVLIECIENVWAGSYLNEGAILVRRIENEPTGAPWLNIRDALAIEHHRFVGEDENSTFGRTSDWRGCEIVWQINLPPTGSFRVLKWHVVSEKYLKSKLTGSRRLQSLNCQDGRFLRFRCWIQSKRREILVAPFWEPNRQLPPGSQRNNLEGEESVLDKNWLVWRNDQKTLLKELTEPWWNSRKRRTSAFASIFGVWQSRTRMIWLWMLCWSSERTSNPVDEF